MSADKGGKTHEGVAAAKEDFKLYLMLYFYVMRDAGLLNREAEMAEQDWNKRTDAFGGSA